MTASPSAPDPGARRLLPERVATLGQLPDAGEDAAMLATIVIALGDAQFAVELRHVVAIEARPQITPLPGTRALWAGLVNAGGAIRPVLDLRAYLRVPAPADEDAPDTVVLVSSGALVVGLLCDGASDVAWVDCSDILSPPAGEFNPRGVIRGVTPELVPLLNVELLLADPALVVDDEGR